MISFTGRAYAAGAAGNVFTSTESSQFSAWSTVTPLPGAFRINSISTYSGTIVYVVGIKGNMYQSINSGVSWNKLTPSISVDFYAISQANDQVAMVLGKNNFVLKTNDGGTLWTNTSVFESLSRSFVSIFPPHSISMLSSSVVAVGTGNVASIQISVDNGNNWDVATDLPTVGINCLKLYSTDVGFAGKNIEIIK